MGAATGVGGVAGVLRGGWEVWPGSGDGGGRCGATFFFPPVWPIRTRHGPYN